MASSWAVRILIWICIFVTVLSFKQSTLRLVEVERNTKRSAEICNIYSLAGLLCRFPSSKQNYPDVPCSWFLKIGRQQFRPMTGHTMEKNWPHKRTVATVRNTKRENAKICKFRALEFMVVCAEMRALRHGHTSSGRFRQVCDGKRSSSHKSMLLVCNGGACV